MRIRKLVNILLFGQQKNLQLKEENVEAQSTDTSQTYGIHENYNLSVKVTI